MKETAHGRGERERRENPIVGLVLNIVVPVVVLMRFSGTDELGPVRALVVALAFPLGYGLYGLFWQGRLNPLSALGVIGVLLTGGIGLLKLDPRWIAVKEAGIPLVIGIAVAASLKTRFALARLLLNKIIDLEMVDEALRQKGALAAFDRRLGYATYMVAGSFLVSAILNYVLARLIVVSPGGTPAFNEELGKMTALSFPVIAVPTMALFVVAVAFVLTGISKLAGLDVKDVVR